MTRPTGPELGKRRYRIGEERALHQQQARLGVTAGDRQSGEVGSGDGRGRWEVPHLEQQVQ